MATVRLFSPFSFVQPQDWVPEVATSTATRFVLENDMMQLRQTFTGRFTYSGGDVSGTVTGIGFSSGGSVVYTVTGLSKSASILQTYAERMGDTQQTHAYVLSGNDSMRGSSGADILYGYGGADRINGAAGDDYLHGGNGADTMAGGTGDDTYIVTNLGDRVNEGTLASDTGGNDHVRSGITFKLGANVERLTLTGTAAVNGTGNAAANTMTGNGAVNVLRGYGGDDSLNGGGGNDILRGDAGSDQLRGGDGADTFDFNQSTETGTDVSNTDVILDFVAGEDVIDLSTIDANGDLDGNGTFSNAGTGAWGGDGYAKLRWENDFGTNRTYIYASVDADFEAEIVIVLNGIHSPENSDFLL